MCDQEKPCADLENQHVGREQTQVTEETEEKTEEESLFLSGTPLAEQEQNYDGEWFQENKMIVTY